MEKYQGEILYHGTDIKFQTWKTGHYVKNKAMNAHSALFFTTDKQYAKGGGEKLASFSFNKKIKPSILNMLNISNEDSEKYRNHILENYNEVSKLFEPIIDPNLWQPCWQEGLTFKLICPNNEEIMYHNNQIEMPNGKRNPSHWMFVQEKTRLLIDYWCKGAKDLGYDILICKEKNTYNLPEPRTSLIYAILNLNIINKRPDWLNC